MTTDRTSEALRGELHPEVAADSALHRIEQLLEPLDDSAQGQRRWADVNMALDVARACRRLLAPHVRAALASQPEPAVTEALERAAQVAEQHAERLKHTSHRDGLGMGWQAGEELCREIAVRIRALAATPESGAAGEAKEHIDTPDCPCWDCHLNAEAEDATWD